MQDVATQAEQIEASHSDFSGFKASTKTMPSDREALRKLIEEATAGIAPDVVDGFERIEPYPLRKCLAVSTPSLVRRSTRIVVDALIEQVGGAENLAVMLGISTDLIRRWSVMVPARHEARCRLIQLNWPVAEKAIKCLKENIGVSRTALRCDIHADEIRKLLDTLNLTHYYKKNDIGA